MNVNGGQTANEQEIYLSDIVAAIGRRKRLIAICFSITVLIGLSYAVFTTPLYTASVTVQPAVDDSGALSGLRGQFGGAAALAGINLGGGGDTKKEEYLAVLQSRALAERFIISQEIMQHLFSEQWNEETNHWRQPGKPGVVSRVTRSVSKVLARLSGDEGWREKSDGEPRLWDAYKNFKKDIISVSEDVQTGIVTVTMKFSDPALTAQWANNYVALANSTLRQKAIDEATRALAYLDGEVQKTTVSGLRNTFFKLVEKQLETITLANARPEYAFKIIDHAVIPEDKSHPKRGVIVILSVILGVMLGVFIALVLEAWLGAFSTQESKDPQDYG